MYKFFTSFFLILTISSCSSLDSLEEIGLELVEMASIDQEFRNRVAPILSTTDFSKPPTEEFLLILNELNEIDSRNTFRLIEIVDEYGWPRKSQVGEKASNAAQLLIQHSGLEHQKYLLPRLRDAVLAEEADASSMAMLEDDILVAEGKDQIYGTEITNGPKGGFILYPVQDPEKLNARRLSVGLRTIEEYIRHAESELGR